MTRPTRPMSATLLAFAEPLLTLAPRPVVHPHLGLLLSLAQRVWNAPLSPVTALPTDADARTLADRLGVPLARVQAALARLEADRRTRFADDSREFASLSVTIEPDGVQVRVEGFDTPAPSGPERLDRRLLERVIDDGLPTGALLAFKPALEAIDAPTLLESLLEAFGPGRLVPSDSWRLASALAFWKGPDAAADALRRALPNARPDQAMPLLNMLGALGADDQIPPLPRSVLATQAEGMWRALPADDSRVSGLLLGMWCTPATGRKVLAEALLAIAPAPERLSLAVLGALSPFAPAVREVFLRAVAESKSAEAHAFLTALADDEPDEPTRVTARRLAVRLGAGRLGDAPLPGSPLAWEPEAAYATFPDATGSQGIYVVRRRPDGALALFGGIINDRRGIVDEIAAPRLTADEIAEALRHMGATGVVAVPAAGAVARLLEGEAMNRRLGYPLPLDYVVDRYLLRGLDASGAPDLAAEARARYDEALGPHTGALLHTRALAGWAIAPDTEPAQAFYAAAHQALEGARRTKARPEGFPGAIAAELDAPYALTLSQARLKAVDAAARQAHDALWTPETRPLWAGRLRQAMWLFALTGREQLASLAATAAVALERGEERDLGFVTGLMRQTAAREVTQ